MPKKYTNEEIIEYFVCGECGGSLELITIARNDFAWCQECQKTHTGVMPEVYEIALEYCNEGRFDYYDRDFYKADPEFVKRLNVGKMCSIVKWLKLKLESYQR